MLNQRLGKRAHVFEESITKIGSSSVLILLANSFHAINEAVKHTLESSSGASRPADRTRRSQFPGSRAGSFDASSIKSVPEPINKERMDQNKKKEPITGRWAVGKRPKQLVSPLPTARMLLFPEATNAFSMVFPL
jgi:hypothetical protein